MPHPQVPRFELIGEQRQLALPYTHYRALGGAALGLTFSAEGEELMAHPPLAALMTDIVDALWTYARYIPSFLDAELQALGLHKINDWFDEPTEAAVFHGPKLDGKALVKGYYKRGAALQFPFMHWMHHVLRLRPRTGPPHQLRLVAPAQYALLSLPSGQGLILMQELPATPLGLLLAKAWDEQQDVHLGQNIERVIHQTRQELTHALGGLGVALASDISMQGNNLGIMTPYDEQFTLGSPLTVAVFDQPATDTPIRFGQAERALRALKAGMLP